jgi:transcriptional regulator with XRE-family HTH domain
MAHIPRLHEYRMKSKLSQAALARLADIDRETVSRAENGFNVQDVKCAQILDALNNVAPFKKAPLQDSAVSSGGKAGPQSAKPKARK